MAAPDSTQPRGGDDGCPSWLVGDSVSEELLKREVDGYRDELLKEEEASQREGATSLLALVTCIWSQRAGMVARTAADFVCDEIRDNGCLSRLLALCSSPERSLQLPVLRALEQVMVSGNRTFIVAHEQLDALISTSCSRVGQDMIRCGTGILENLFKASTETCHRLIQSGALEGITFGCRSSDTETLQHCAAALANCAMYGDRKVHKAMVSRRYNAEHWLFPLAFSDNAVVKYYALLAICFLAADEAIENQVAESGTLDLVLPFLNTRDPDEFSRECPGHAHGRSEGWLQRLVVLLESTSEEARSMAAFLFAMEAGIKKKQSRLDIFHNIGAISKLQNAAKFGSHLTANLCCQALSTAKEPLPDFQCWNVLHWTADQVYLWAADIIGRRRAQSVFNEKSITGNMLVDITVSDLLDIGFSENKLQCKAFVETNVRLLRCLADVSSQDKDGVCKWLTSIHQDLAVYRIDFARCGITKSLLPHLTTELLKEIGVHSGVDQLKILLALRELPDYVGHDTPDAGVLNRSFSLTPVHHGRYDVFMSYRRATGSQLASLLKVHLHLHGLNVFLDVAELGGGKFDDALLTTISHSHNVILVLSPHSLDRCYGDTPARDWVHKEVLCALDNRVNIVPVIADGFTWPSEMELPADIQPLCKMNGVRWSHEYQDACVEKLVKFLHLSTTSRRRSTVSFSTVRSVELPAVDVTVS